MNKRTVEIYDKCTLCNKTLHSIVEGERGECSSCWFKKMPKDTKKAMNALLAAAFKPTTDAEKDIIIETAFEKLERDEKEQATLKDS